MSNTAPNIAIGRYAAPVPDNCPTPFVAWIMPDVRAWVLYVRQGAEPLLFLRREQPNGEHAYVSVLDAG